MERHHFTMVWLGNRIYRVGGYSTTEGKLPNQVFEHRGKVIVRRVELGDIQLVFDEEFGEPRIESVRLVGLDNNIA